MLSKHVSVTNALDKKARAFVTRKTFQPSLSLVGLARALYADLILPIDITQGLRDKCSILFCQWKMLNKADFKVNKLVIADATTDIDRYRLLSYIYLFDGPGHLYVVQT